MTTARGCDILLLKYKNNMKRSFFSLLALLLPCLALAHDFIVDGICYNVVSEEDKCCEVTFNSDEIILLPP